MSKKSLTILISLAVSAALVFIFVMPFWSSIKTLRITVAQEKDKVEKMEELITKVEQLEIEYQEVEEEAQRVFLSLPKEKDEAFLLVQFESLAINNGLLLEQIDISPITDPTKSRSRRTPPQPSPSQQQLTGLKISSVNVSLSGSYNALKKYLTGLENSIRSMSIRSILFDATPEIEKTGIYSSGIFEFDLRIDVYFQ